MGKRYRKARNFSSSTQARVPHVIILAGQHAPGIEVPVQKVIEHEKPVLLGIEAIHGESDVSQIIEFFRTRAERHAKSKTPQIAYEARLYLLAKRAGIPFHFIEKYSALDVTKWAGLSSQIGRYLHESIEHATRGEVETALDLHKKATSMLSPFTIARNPVMVAEIERLARSAEGRPITVLVGAAHSPIIKQLVSRGIKVTLYHSPGNVFTNAMPGIAPGGKATRQQHIRLIFQSVLATYLRDRYELTDLEMASLTQRLESFRQLKRTPPIELENLFRESKGMSEVAFRSHLVSFLERKGVKLPSSQEMAKLKPALEALEFRRVKVFEPHK